MFTEIHLSNFSYSHAHSIVVGGIDDTDSLIVGGCLTETKHQAQDY